MKVSVSKLLKTKNRLTSELTRVKSKILNHNVYIFDEETPEKTPEFNVLQLKAEYDDLTNKLITVKTALSTANLKAVEKIYRLAEVKGQIAFYEKLSTAEGKERSYYASESVTIKKAQINSSQKDQLVKDLIKQAEQLQDDLDEFNATHRIEVADDLFV